MRYGAGIDPDIFKLAQSYGHQYWTERQIEKNIRAGRNSGKKGLVDVSGLSKEVRRTKQASGAVRLADVLSKYGLNVKIVEESTERKYRGLYDAESNSIVVEVAAREGAESVHKTDYTT